MTYGQALAQKPLPRGSINLQFWYNLPWSSLLYTKFVWTMPQNRKEDFQKNTLILHFLPPKYLPLGWGHEMYNFLSPCPIDATY